ncbi:uncharacterized protein LOC143432033 [Xylocopa sonorina]|uniref:uncharacterized protein LOC143432033 n=1 Tax=Xylocopa sonorina TaxID=1818115 RepID=UPI00403A967E
MSEESEHTSEETAVEMNVENHDKEQTKCETSILSNDVEQPMLEDEEMPTYISVSSPSRREDSQVNNTKQQDNSAPADEDLSRSPYPSDDQGGGSIYVLSSGEESNRAYNDDDEDDYVDSDDMDEMDLENEHENAILDEEEDDDEDDDDDDEIDGEYEHECFDRASDDFILNNRLKQHHKERSLSLQDLSISKSNAHLSYNKKRHSLSIFKHNYLNIQPNPVLYHVMHKKQITPTAKYQHVPSKVKQYIRSIKEQNRKSIEKRKEHREQEFMINKSHDENEDNDVEQLKTKTATKTIKDYAEKAIKDLQQEETEGDNLIYNTAQIIENGENNKTSNKGIENQYKNALKDIEYNDIQHEKHMQNCDDKLEKRNGSVDVNAHHIEYQNTVDRHVRFGSINQASLVNGHQQAPTFINLRTLSYEEYIHGSSNTEQREELSEPRQEKANEPEEYNEAEMIDAQEIDNSNTSCPLKIASVKSIRIIQDESENLNFAKISAADSINAENTEIIELKAQLNQKDAQFQNLRDAYQRVLAENIKIKQELDALKKSLVKPEKESKACETKIAAIQTDAIVESIPNQEIVTTAETNNKVSTSSVTSTISSIDHWAESAYSPAISIKPPDLTPIFNSDDSMVLTNGNTPRKLANPLSRTFITSSRILQTLSNITQGKTKIQNPLIKNNKKQSNVTPNLLLNLDCNSPINASSSKKRKATEMLGTSNFAQPFKIPHTTLESERKNSIDAANVELKYCEEHTSLKSEPEKNITINKDINGSTSVQSKIEETDDQADNVKCFIYKEDDNSKNKSFLIQAEEPAKDRLNNDKNSIQECGPYLLGNLEIRLSEINGIISVWGKEISHESTSNNEDDIEVSIKSEKKPYHSWQNTSQTRFNGSPLVCSTSKKQKIPLKFSKFNTSQCCHAPSLNSPSLADDINVRRHMGNICNTSTYVSDCGNCNSSKCHKEWPTCTGASSSQENIHSCCTHHIETIDKECNCDSYHKKQKHDLNPNCCKDKFHNAGVRKNSYRNTLMTDSKNHSHENITNGATEITDVICKYHSCQRSLQNVVDNCLRSKCCNNIRDVSGTCKSSSDNINNHECSDKHTHSHTLSNDGEEIPLISPKRTNETPETRQRRLSGKRVRGILMDLLKGCSDCRTTSTTGLNKSGVQQKGTLCMANDPPQIKISHSPMSEPTCSTSAQCNDRCCHACARRIESQLEEFRIEMERVRSRSDAILDMLNMLYSVDMN